MQDTLCTRLHLKRSSKGIFICKSGILNLLLPLYIVTIVHNPRYRFETGYMHLVQGILRAGLQHSSACLIKYSLGDH
jgi:hypothetical protein